MYFLKYYALLPIQVGDYHYNLEVTQHRRNTVIEHGGFHLNFGSCLWISAPQFIHEKSIESFAWYFIQYGWYHTMCEIIIYFGGNAYEYVCKG
ncbi:MAG: hypothetical protein VX777_00870 [Chlamydiota bacterium]|nr:hypothetical protein [Chlamydiota bacterium]